MRTPADLLRRALRSATGHRPWQALALLAICLRALAPQGYMLMATREGPRWMPCPAAAPLPAAMAAGMAMDMPMDAAQHAAHLAALHAGTAGGGTHPAAGAGDAGATCPFALAGGAPLARAPAQAPGPGFLLLLPASDPERAGIALPVPLRHSAPRGPPRAA